MSENKDKDIETPNSLGNLIGNESAQITFENMKKLCNQKEYTVNGVKYTRKILKPKELVELFKLNKQLSDLDDDPEARMNIIKDQAKTCLKIQDEKDFDTEWEETDVVQMETIVGACLLIARGF